MGSNASASVAHQETPSPHLGAHMSGPPMPDPCVMLDEVHSQPVSKRERESQTFAAATAFAFPHNLPLNIRIFDVGGSGMKSKRFMLKTSREMLDKNFTVHSDFIPHLELEYPLNGQLQLGCYRSGTARSPIEWVRQLLDAEAEKTGVPSDSEKTAYTVSNGFLTRVGLPSPSWKQNFKQDQPFPFGLPIVDPNNNLDGTGGIDDTLAHFYDAQVRAIAADYPLLNVACGTFCVFLYAETEKSMPTRATHMVPAGRRLAIPVRQLQELENLELESSKVDTAKIAELNAKIRELGERVMQDLFSTLATVLRDIANSARWSTTVVVDETCKLNYPEIAANATKQVKSPSANKLIKTIVFSGGVAQNLPIVQRAEEWYQKHKQSLPNGSELKFKIGDENAPHTGAAAYVLDSIMHPNPEQRVFQPKFPNARY